MDELDGPNLSDRIEGAVLGSAFGDAWGEPLEFLLHTQILEQRHSFPERAMISDDTQMSLYLLKGIKDLVLQGETFGITQITGDENVDNKQIFTDEKPIRVAIANRFLEWFYDPLNNRAPGAACLKGMEGYAGSTRQNGLEGTIWEAMGCGANMRVGWLGLLNLTENEVARLAQIQAEITHGHGKAGASAVITALVVWNLIHKEEFRNLSGKDLYDWAINKCNSLKDSDLWGWRAKIKDGYEALSLDLTGWKDKLPLVQEAIDNNTNIDLNLIFDGGWTAPSALGNALAILAVTDEFHVLEAMNLTVTTSGDSDSIAAIVGAFLGAKYGIEEFPADWVFRIEPNYQTELDETISFIESTWKV